MKYSTNRPQHAPRNAKSFRARKIQKQLNNDLQDAKIAIADLENMLYEPLNEFPGSSSLVDWHYSEMRSVHSMPEFMKTAEGLSKWTFDYIREKKRLPNENGAKA